MKVFARNLYNNWKLLKRFEKFNEQLNTVMDKLEILEDFQTESFHLRTLAA